jgi:myo-inositol-1(or 4)-monophosphatase
LNREHYLRICEHITSAERKAGEIILKAGENIHTHSKSGRRDVVTQYDKQVQDFLMDELGRALPGAAFFSEERENENRLGDGYVFIIDPIDGTMNFVKGMNHSCISVACAFGGEIIAGAVYNPFTDEMFSGAKGCGANVNGRAITVTDDALVDSIVNFGTAPYNAELSAPTFDAAGKAFAASLDIRRRGSAALDLCDVAAGRAGLYFEMAVSLWDYAAGAFLVTEAGGLCVTTCGSPVPYGPERTSIVAGNRQTVAEFVALIG